MEAARRTGPERRRHGRERVGKTVVVMLGVLCLVVGGAAYALVQVAGRLAADLHRSAVALDALVVRVASVEEDLATISDDVYSIADDLAVIADSLALSEDDDGEGGESVVLRGRASRAREAAVALRVERVRARQARGARFASVADRRGARTAIPAEKVATRH